jgi:signal transduction protein with GAF and PtsI domain
MACTRKKCHLGIFLISLSLRYQAIIFLIHTLALLKIRTETSPEDIGGMHSAVGILTARGGMTSHAAVVARGWGKCCVSGCSDIQVNEHEKVTS